MNAIIKNDNVYVVIKDKELRNDINLDGSDNLIIFGYNQKSKSLFGGRVKICPRGSYDCQIYVDGIEINNFEYYDSSYSEIGIKIQSEISIGCTAAFLNQMENLGIDSFLDNYKTRLEEYKKELEKYVQYLQQELSLEDSDDKRKLLFRIQKTLLCISCLLFALLVNMNAGLSNQHYISAYDTIVNMYF